jgi:hypothetical protein
MRVDAATMTTSNRIVDHAPQPLKTLNTPFFSLVGIFVSRPMLSVQEAEHCMHSEGVSPAATQNPPPMVT